MQRINRWINGTPQPGEVVEVWYLAGIEPARWDGRNWRDKQGHIIVLVSHYMPANAETVEAYLAVANARPGLTATGPQVS